MVVAFLLTAYKNNKGGALNKSNRTINLSKDTDRWHSRMQIPLLITINNSKMAGDIFKRLKYETLQNKASLLLRGRKHKLLGCDLAGGYFRYILN